MSILGIGVDIVETARIQHSLDRFGERFLHRVFTQGEIDYCKSMGWRDIDVHRQESGQPYVVLEGGAKQLAAERGVSAVWLSLSHTEHHAVATVVIEQ